MKAGEGSLGGRERKLSWAKQILVGLEHVHIQSQLDTLGGDLIGSVTVGRLLSLSGSWCDPLLPGSEGEAGPWTSFPLSMSAA